MRFDRRSAGGGVEAACRLDNGKAVLEWRFSFTDMEEPVHGREEGPAERRSVHVRLVDREGCVAVECEQDPYEEETLTSVMVQPHLWNGVRYPYLYHMEAELTDGDGRRLDRLCRSFPLRSIRGKSGTGEGLLLNDVPFTPRMVRYTLPAAASGAAMQQRMLEDLRQLVAVGANSVLVEEEREELTRILLPLCDRVGLLACAGARRGTEEEIPLFRGEEDSFFLPDGKRPSSLFYRYKARWSEEPFVYIVPESVRRLGSGNYTALCYSNCARVALYSDGVLFEFQRGEGEFVFREFPARGPCVMLTAEGDGCSESLSVHKTFVKPISRYPR